MGCGISRPELDEDDDAQSPLPNQSLPRIEEHIHHVALKNKNNNKDAQINGSSSSDQSKSQPQTQISSSMLTSIRQDPTMYIQVSTYKGNHVNKSAEDLPRLSISIKKDIGDHDDQRMSNLDADDHIDPRSCSLSGSPSFREYCVVENDCHSQDDQYDIFDGNKNNIDDEERDKTTMMSKEASRSNSTVLIGKKKGDKRSMLKKVFPIMHRPAAAVRK